jgi:hypothetical protein
MMLAQLSTAVGRQEQQQRQKPRQQLISLLLDLPLASLDLALAKCPLLPSGSAGQGLKAGDSAVAAGSKHSSSSSSSKQL